MGDVQPNAQGVQGARMSEILQSAAAYIDGKAVLYAMLNMSIGVWMGRRLERDLPADKAPNASEAKE